MTVSIELLIRNLLYFANMHIRELSAVLDIPAPKKELVREEAGIGPIVDI